MSTDGDVEAPDKPGDAGPPREDGAMQVDANAVDAPLVDARPGVDAPLVVDAPIDAAIDAPPPIVTPPSSSPVEPVWQPTRVSARIKSPGQRMRFTAGLPIRILADATDPNAYQCPPGHPPYVCPDSFMTFYVDGAVVGTAPPDPANFNLWELRLPNGLPVGDHVITVRFTPHNATSVAGLVPVYIKVDPVPTKATTINLTSNIVLSGNTELNWTNALVRGNGYRVTAASGYAGRVVINNSLVTGLGGYDQLGIDVTTSGPVDITDSTFEATGAVRLVVNGTSPISLVHNELRSTNYVTYVSADPNKSPILDLSGNTAGLKRMQGNNVGAGIVKISNMSGWQIGGLRDSQGNVFVGPRCVLQLDAAPDAVIQGNYLHHDYYGGFSQGFNLHFTRSSNALAEHNVIRDSSWPVQSFGGELRYNLLINSGHDFMRGAQSQARIHHNIFVHAQSIQSGYDGAIFLYGGEQGVTFDNNTIDVGGATGRYDAPALALGSSVSLASVRNNVFSQFSSVSWGNRALVAGARTEASVAGSRIAKADYNAWYNPLATNTGRYMPGIVAGTPGAHDVGTDPMFAGAVPQVPYLIDEGMVWLRTYGISQVLAYYRALYTPRTGSPLIDAGDSADGAGNDIGAVGAGTAHAADKFGKVMQAN
ncbi:MAG: right-handed parallel beta-helix repeat-containing protein [Kofleriaceae bacterium]|nr:right-handed parallel beta-helix repeat-containing protein [Kofleriaceae bacterium]